MIHLNVQDAASQPLMQRYGFEFTPTFILLDPSGQLSHKWVGAIDPIQVTQALSTN